MATLKKRNSYTRFGSDMRQVSVKARLKLTNTPSTSEPQSISAAKTSLKRTKHITLEIEPIANSLYHAQLEKCRLLTKLSETLTGMPIMNKEDKFGIFMNNIGRASKNNDEIYQMLLINMEDQLLKPLVKFNKTQIKKCQHLKTVLNTKKGEFDIKKNDENKLLTSQHAKKVNLEKIHVARRKSMSKLDELEDHRNNFIDAMNEMEKEKICLMESMHKYMQSYSAYADIQAQNITMQTTDYMQWVPPNINNSFGLDSDTEDVNDNEHTMSTFPDWTKTSVVVKSGWAKKRGKIHKAFKRRWFKLYTNLKLIYSTKEGPNGKLKGHINLQNIIYIMKKSPHCIDIKTESRLWTLQFEDIEDRDEWYIALVETKGVSITDHAESWHIDRGMPMPPKYTYGDEIDDDDDQKEKEKAQIDEGTEEDKVQLIGADSAESPSEESVEIEGTETICDLSMVQCKFKVNMDSIRLFEDGKLKKEVFHCVLEKDEIVTGRFVTDDVIELAPKLFANAMDLTELEEEEDAFRQNLVDKIVANDMILDDIVNEMGGTSDNSDHVTPM